MAQIVTTPEYINASTFAVVAHSGQSRGERPYVEHPLRVSHSCFIFDDDIAIIGAVLHDVVEDTEYTIDTLRLMNYSPEVIEVVRLLTRTPAQSRKAYIANLIDSGNVSALRVKLMDAIDNSMWSSFDEQWFANWRDRKQYYRELVEKLWAVYLERYVTPDTDTSFMDRVRAHWAVIDDIDYRISQKETNVLMTPLRIPSHHIVLNNQV